MTKTTTRPALVIISSRIDRDLHADLETLSRKLDGVSIHDLVRIACERMVESEVDESERSHTKGWRGYLSCLDK